MSAEERRFYRLVRVKDVRRDDLASNTELERVPRRPLSREQQDLWDGLSVFESIELAVAHYRRSRQLGRYALEISLRPTDALRMRRTTDTPGHWTIWADTDVLVSRVTAIIAVDGSEGMSS